MVNARRLTDLSNDECKLLFGNPADVDLDVKSVINPEFCTETSRDDV
jgi:hypothetical protein